MPLIMAQTYKCGTINNDPGIDCPNANWNGSTANYCNGTAPTMGPISMNGDTPYIQSLPMAWAWQSGTINGSFSDIWGGNYKIC
jgi:hypothetical protein